MQYEPVERDEGWTPVERTEAVDALQDLLVLVPSKDMRQGIELFSLVHEYICSGSVELPAIMGHMEDSGPIIMPLSGDDGTLRQGMVRMKEGQWTLEYIGKKGDAALHAKNEADNQEAHDRTTPPEEPAFAYHDTELAEAAIEEWIAGDPSRGIVMSQAERVLLRDCIVGAIRRAVALSGE